MPKTHIDIQQPKNLSKMRLKYFHRYFREFNSIGMYIILYARVGVWNSNILLIYFRREILVNIGLLEKSYNGVLQLIMMRLLRDS
jgi:hypothetical protein